MHPMRALFLIPRNPPPRLNKKSSKKWSKKFESFIEVGERYLQSKMMNDTRILVCFGERLHQASIHRKFDEVCFGRMFRNIIFVIVRHTFIRDQVSDRIIRGAIKEHVDRHRKVLKKG